MVGGKLAPHVPWQAMVYIADSILDGGFAGGALISDQWVLTAGRNVFVRKSRGDIQGKDPVVPKVYLGISRKAEANASSEVAVEKVSNFHFQFQFFLYIFATPPQENTQFQDVSFSKKMRKVRLDSELLGECDG